MNLKFRAWHKELKFMAPVVSIESFEPLICWVKYGVDHAAEASPPNIELMQWTGWNDAEGKPIFEGDIIDCGHGDDIGRMKVQWDLDKCMFCFMWIGEPWDWREFDEFSEDDLLIVGNIYENSELLEESCKK